MATSVSHTAQAVTSSSSTQFAQQHAAQPLAELAAAAAPVAVPQADTAAASPLGLNPTTALLLGGAMLAGYGIKKVFDTPSRAYDQNVGQEYDAWTEEGVLEYYWGEHIHLGYYTEEASCCCCCCCWAGRGCKWAAGHRAHESVVQLGVAASMPTH